MGCREATALPHESPRAPARGAWEEGKHEGMGDKAVEIRVYT